MFTPLRSATVVSESCFSIVLDFWDRRSRIFSSRCKSSVFLVYLFDICDTPSYCSLVEQLFKIRKTPISLKRHRWRTGKEKGSFQSWTGEKSTKKRREYHRGSRVDCCYGMLRNCSITDLISHPVTCLCDYCFANKKYCLFWANKIIFF